MHCPILCVYTLSAALIHKFIIHLFIEIYEFANFKYLFTISLGLELVNVAQESHTKTRI